MGGGVRGGGQVLGPGGGVQNGRWQAVIERVVGCRPVIVPAFLGLELKVGAVQSLMVPML